MPRHAHALAKTHASKRQPKRQPIYVVHFIGLHAGDARLISARTGIPAEVILAQSALESNWGRSVKGNAYFGIKGKSAMGKSTAFSTHEVTLSGQRISEVWHIAMIQKNSLKMSRGTVMQRIRTMRQS
jgi:flagellum-specific peptidoglycan hydrolase FlgJ